MGPFSGLYLYLFDPDLPPKLKTFEQASASQIKTFRECERKWALGKLAGLRAPETESQLRGTRIHRILELYLKGEAPIPNTQEGRCRLPVEPAGPFGGPRPLARALLQEQGKPTSSLSSATWTSGGSSADWS